MGKIVFIALVNIFLIIIVVLFNRKILRENRSRAAKNFAQNNFLHKEIAEIIIETIEDCKKNFSSVLEIGARNGELGNKIAGDFLVQSDSSTKMVWQNNLQLVMDDEFLCFKEQSFDLIISNLNLHLINEIPQNLLQIKKLLKPGGMFIASFFGEENLKELRQVFYQIEQQFYNGITPRIIPNIDVKSAGMLLQKAGFANVIAEKYSFEVKYSSAKKILQDLKNMGEANVLEGRSRKFITKKFLFDLTNLYQKLYCRQQNQYAEANLNLTKSSSAYEGQDLCHVENQNKCVATYEIIILSGWQS